MIVNNTTGEITKSDTTSNIDKYLQNYTVGVDPYNKEEFEKSLYSMTNLDKTNRIEQVIKALGTMVLFPQEISDPNNIGQKVYGQPVQRPILEGEARTKVLNKLVELITE